MTVAVWPGTLPCPSRRGYSRTRIDSRRKRSVDGPDMFDARTSRVGKAVAMTLTMTRGQLVIFNEFLDDTLVKGTQPFWMPDPLLDMVPVVVEGVPLVDSNGHPILMTANVLCKMAGQMPVEEAVGARCRVSFYVTQMP